MKVTTKGPVIGADRETAVAFLRTAGYSQSILPVDDVFAAYVGSDIVGAVRLAHENGLLVLRGLRVREELRRRGIGQQLLRHLEGALGKGVCWCVPYAWLTDFYGTIGFQMADDGTCPEFLAARRRRYIEQGLDVVIMVRR